MPRECWGVRARPCSPTRTVPWRISRCGCIEADVEAEVRVTRPVGILVFDPLGGVTGHSDHRAASQAAIAVAARHGVPVLGWALPQQVSRVLNDSHGAAFEGHPPQDLTAITAIPVTVDQATDSVVSAPPGRG
jgi:LmbE family N-acetylglucosaminyl deacetylase